MLPCSSINSWDSNYIGTILSDSHTYQHDDVGEVKLIVKDKSYALSFAEALKDIGIKPRIIPPEKNKGFWLVLAASSSDLYYLVETGGLVGDTH